MAAKHKHSYRFVYLRSDKWKDVRLEALLREKMFCQICKEEDFFNDAHHIFYPKSVWDTEADDLVILCRDCHNMIHSFFEQQPSRKKGKIAFVQITKVIQKWVGLKSKRLLEKIQHESSGSDKIQESIISTTCKGCGDFKKPVEPVDILSEFSMVIAGVSATWFLCPDCRKDLKLNAPDLNGLVKGSAKYKNEFFKSLRIWSEKRLSITNFKPAK